MLAAAFTSPIIPGIEQYSGGDPLPTLFGVVLGVIFLDRADVLVPTPTTCRPASAGPTPRSPANRSRASTRTNSPQSSCSSWR